jgi:hypothetical protein
MVALDSYNTNTSGSIYVQMRTKEASSRNEMDYTGNNELDGV